MDSLRDVPCRLLKLLTAVMNHAQQGWVVKIVPFYTVWFAFEAGFHAANLIRDCFFHAYGCEFVHLQEKMIRGIKKNKYTLKR